MKNTLQMYGFARTVQIFNLFIAIL